MYLCVGLSFIKCFIKCSMSLIWILIVCSSSFFFLLFLPGGKKRSAPPSSCDPHPKKLKIVFVVTTLAARGILGVASSVKSWWWLYQKIVFSLSSFLEKSSLSFSLLLYFQLFAENRCNFAGHECPRYAWVGQRTFFAWWTVDFSTRSLKDRRLFEISWWWIILRWLSNDVTAKKIHSKSLMFAWNCLNCFIFYLIFLTIFMNLSPWHHEPWEGLLLPVVWCFRDCMENRIYDEQLMGTERSEYLLIVLDKSYLRHKTDEKLINRTFMNEKRRLWTYILVLDWQVVRVGLQVRYLHQPTGHSRPMGWHFPVAHSHYLTLDCCLIAIVLRLTSLLYLKHAAIQTIVGRSMILR